jgi:hypothetical protein
MTASLQSWSISLLRLLLILALLAGTAFYVYQSIHWALICDSPIMHYVNFLMAHGFQPYQNITDNNLPGAYLTEFWAMHLFGAGDLGWRLYDYFLLALTTGAMVVVADRDWLAGLFGGCFFLLQHGSEGAVAAGEREQLITALVLVGYACLFVAVRRRLPALLLPFGFVSCLAATIKPTIFPLGVFLLILSGIALHQRAEPLRRYLLWAVAGYAIPLLFVAVFLFQHHAFGPFWFVMHSITPGYVELAHPSAADMLRLLLPRDVRWFVVFVGAPAILIHFHWDWERWALAIGMAVGLISYYIQHKGFNHHRYIFLALLLLIIGIDLMRNLKTPGWPRLIGAAGLLITIGYFVPSYCFEIRNLPKTSVLTDAMESDLVHLGGDQLQRKVMCFDLVYGCLNSLYHLNLVENAGFTGDLLFFFPQSGRAAEYYRNMFWDTQKRDPATVFVVTNEWLQQPNTFDKMNTWPAFVSYLDANYTLVVSREFPAEGRTVPRRPWRPGDDRPPAYRIYIRNGTPLLAAAPALLHQP